MKKPDQRHLSMNYSALELTKRLIQCRSVTPVDDGAIGVLEDFLNQAGFKCQRMEFDGDGGDKTLNLYAKFGGVNTPNLCFAGHTDVVPAGDERDWSFPPFSANVSDGYLYGRGAEDMKTAIACFASAAALYIRENPNFKGSISFLITGDEEGNAINGTKKALQKITELGEKIDACIVGEPTNPNILGEMAKIGRRGSITFKLSVEGTQGHVAYPQFADNPLTKLVAILHELKNHVLDSGNQYFQPSNLEITSIDTGNGADNVIPARAIAKINIRFNDVHSSESLIKWVHEVCKKHSPNYQLDYRVTGESFITKPSRLSDILINAIKEVTGITPELSTTGGTSDARFIKDYCPVIEFGTTGRTAHKVDENVAVEDIEKLKAIYLSFIKSFFS